MVAEASLRNSHCAGLAGRPSFLEFSGKSENRAPRQKKQMASQYLLSLPNTQGIEEKLWGCQTQEGSQTPWSLWSVEETEEARTWVCRVGATTGSGSLSSSLLSPLDHNGPQSWLWRSPRPASSSFLSGSAHISPLSFPTAVFWLRLIISELSVCNCLLTSFLYSSLWISLISSVYCQINTEIPCRLRNTCASQLLLASWHWKRSSLPGAAALLSPFLP